MHLLFATVPGPAQKYIQGTKFSPFLRVLTHGINALLSVGGTLTIAHIINHYHNTTNPPANNPSLPIRVCVGRESEQHADGCVVVFVDPTFTEPCPASAPCACHAQRHRSWAAVVKDGSANALLLPSQ